MTEKGLSTPALDEGLVASLVLSIEEITPHHKKRKMSEKGKEKVGPVFGLTLRRPWLVPMNL